MGIDERSPYMDLSRRERKIMDAIHRKEMGHGGAQLVNRIYGHAQRVAHRSEAVEHRVKRHERVLLGHDRQLHGGLIDGYLDSCLQLIPLS